MDAMRDYYEVLQVQPIADPDVIESAYRRLSLKLHPDRGGSTARMVELNVAYEVLRDAGKRAEYDAKRRATAAGTPRAPTKSPKTWNAKGIVGGFVLLAFTWLVIEVVNSAFDFASNHIVALVMIATAVLFLTRARRHRARDSRQQNS